MRLMWSFPLFPYIKKLQSFNAVLKNRNNHGNFDEGHLWVTVAITHLHVLIPQMENCIENIWCNGALHVLLWEPCGVHFSAHFSHCCNMMNWDVTTFSFLSSGISWEIIPHVPLLSVRLCLLMMLFVSLKYVSNPRDSIPNKHLTTI